MTALEIVERIKRKDNTDDEWLQIMKDIITFLKENPDSEDRKYFVPLGYSEMVTMICDGILRERGSSLEEYFD
ncbi:hypothetical protein B5E58_11155 [Tyzzerella sp. An114]|uniref:hypothetical protein n=1 Tax=Tyzzerella sp. An114 TaxID=1965545 RepID=UPI000B438765|nr:hypothetical protein [Tyzzerella sp. An114]OUQ56225.1 hypothetical protein B5E58_11155 [Tyzzerella sp. An114]